MGVGVAVEGGTGVAVGAGVGVRAGVAVGDETGVAVGASVDAGVGVAVGGAVEASRGARVGAAVPDGARLLEAVHATARNSNAAVTTPLTRHGSHRPLRPGRRGPIDTSTASLPGRVPGNRVLDQSLFFQVGHLLPVVARSLAVDRFVVPSQRRTRPAYGASPLIASATVPNLGSPLYGPVWPKLGIRGITERLFTALRVL